MGQEPSAESLGGRCLAVLRRVKPQTMTAAELATRLESKPGKVSTALGSLTDRNLVTRDGRNFRAADEEAPR